MERRVLQRETVSFDHEILVELFRNRPELAVELIAASVGLDARLGRVELGSIDLSRVISVEYRADAVVLRDRANGVISAVVVVVEVQTTTDVAKHLSWPQYITSLRAREGCPVMLLVVATDEKVARWARKPIETGHPKFVLEPVVIGFDDVPTVTGAPNETPELAVLSTLAHPTVEVARVALAAIQALPTDRSTLYFDLILRALDPVCKAVIEAEMMKNYEFRSAFAKKFYGQGRDEGRAKGRDEGREEGREAGELNGARRAILQLARLRSVATLEQLDEALATRVDRTQLDELLAALADVRAGNPAQDLIDAFIAGSKG